MTVALIKTPPVKSGGTYEINKGKAKLVREPNEIPPNPPFRKGGDTEIPPSQKGEVKPKTKEN